MADTRRRRRRRDIRRVRQRNRRVLLVFALTCFILWAGIVNWGKEKDKKQAQETYAEQQSEEKTQKDEEVKENDTGLKMADEDEKDKWYLKLVNGRNTLKKEDVPDLVTETVDQMGYQVDKRIVGALEEMFTDARAEGLDPVICSAYRSWEQQVSLYNNKINRVMAEEGISQKEAAAEAATVVAKQGTSEHQLGLALDIVSSSNQILDEEQMHTEEQKWLMENSWKYGFILRYPPDKSDITGIIFEPWHYRYVGEKAAKEITEQDITLEEYLGAEPVGSTDIEFE